ncbi:MAG: glycosyltransferase family 39 protein [Flavobacteriales bacterium]|nr:glycosyltransferase family 39 protein [Flavobacteriales bacterium]
MPFSQTVDADAVTRIFLSLDWIENPTWISESVWGPLHFYLNGLALAIWKNPVYTPKILNIILSTFSLIPFYYFTKREFNNNGALITTIFLALSPILFRNSFFGLSETPYLFFLVLAMNWLSKWIKERKTLFLILSGIAITIASGIRYEAWMIMAIWGVFVLVKYDFKNAFIFSVFALIFPFIWMMQSYLNTGNPFSGIEGNFKWTMDVMDNNANLNFESYLRRIWYFPFIWVISVGPPLAFILLKDHFQFKKFNNAKFYSNIWFITLIIVFVFIIINSLKGTLLLHARFVGSILIFSLPFAANFFRENTIKTRKLSVLFISLSVGLSFFYNISNVKPIPRLENQNAKEIAKKITKYKGNSTSLYIDDWGWDNTYYIGLNSGVHHKNISFINQYSQDSEIIKKLKQSIQFNGNRLLLLSNASQSEKILTINYSKNTIQFNSKVHSFEILSKNQNVTLIKIIENQHL